MWHVVAAGFLFFPGVYQLSNCCARRSLPGWVEADYSVLSSRVVSFVQGVLAAVSGIIVVTSCKDVKYDRHWLATTYLWVLIPYMVYDINVMYLRHWYKCKDSKVLNGKDHFSAAMNSLLKKEFLMLVHHIGTLTILAPIGLFIRGDIGDFYVGCLLVAEMSTPFVSLGKILIQLNLQNTLLHKVNGAFVLLTFFVCRILLFPYMYHAYGKQFGIPAYKVPFNIPMHCNITNAAIMAPQIYWFWLICRKAVRLYSNSTSSKDR